MFVSSALSIVLLLISVTDAARTDPVAYEKAVVAQRGIRYQKLLMKSRKILSLILENAFNQLELDSIEELQAVCSPRSKYALSLYQTAMNSYSTAVTALANNMTTYNTSKAVGRLVKRAFINAKLFQRLVESPYCKRGQPWNYQGLLGPQRWPISFSKCDGKIQTPINLEDDCEAFNQIKGYVSNNGLLPQITYPNTPGELHHLGDVVKFVPDTVDGTYVYNDGQYRLIQWHIHTPSEHRIGERDFVAEIHFVHQLGNNLAVIGGFVDLSNVTSPFLKSLIQVSATLKAGEEAPFTPDYVSTIQALKSSESFYRYIGSLTTPPCTEGVRWLVAKKPIYTVNPTDLNAMMANWGFNSRDTKPLFPEHDEKLVVARTGLNYYNPPVGLGFTPSSNWSYEGMGGAERWSLYYPECKGNIQTPINIAPESKEFKTIRGLVKNNGRLPHIHYPDMEGEIKNKGGKTYQFTPHHGAGKLYRPDGVFDFAQLHIHLPSEHRVGEKDFVGEIHFVHTLGSSLAVLGGFMAISNVTDSFTKKFLDAAFPIGINDHAEFNASFDEVVKKFEKSPNYYKYVGSLTIPPCTEGVRWLIAEEPIFTISPADINTYMDKIGFSARDTLPLHYEADYDWVAQRTGLEIFNPMLNHEALKSVPIPSEAMYEGFEGPQFWGFQNSQCDGMRQTPINFAESDMHFIKGALNNSGALARVIYPNTPGDIAHKGDVIKFTPSKITGKYIRPEGAFDLLQWHIHVPSEHRVEGKEFVGEVHFVHKLGNTLAVIGGFVELADYSSEFIAHMMEAIKDLAPHGHADFHPHYDHVALELRAIPKFFKYTGSLTTPPCSEGVKWLVAEEPLFKISPTDWVLLMSKTGGNSRDTKPLRYQANVNWAQERSVPEFFNPPMSAEASQDWNYNGIKGPEYWGVSYPMCDANIQTPINIQPESHDFEEISGTLVNGGSLPLIHYPNGKGYIKNVGDTWKFTPDNPNAGRLIRPEGSFSMVQWHLHLPSEHRINGIDAVGELHFVHTLGNSLAVVGTFINLATESSPIISQFFTAGKDLNLNEKVAWTPDYTDVVRNLKSADKYYKYTGSLTTPPCTEGVKWMVASKAALNISYKHVLEYQSKFGFTARDTKPLKYNADLDWAEKRMAPKFFNPASGTSLPNTTLSYNGFDGPAYWMMNNAACGGNIQTPINFVANHPDSTAIGLVLDNTLHKYPALSYPADSKAAGKLKNYGDTLKFTPDTKGAATFTRPDGIYDMIQFHFHIMSEHRVDSMEYPMEFHFVHQLGTNLAVIGGFVQLGDTTSDFILKMLDAGKNLPIQGSVAFSPVYTDVVAKLKAASKFFKYTGSLTTPPCSEGVKWLVAETPIFTITAEHWKEFMKKFEYSARDTQPLRNSADYDWVAARKSDYYKS